MTPRFECTTPEITPEHPVLVLGGGPAGLTAGYLLAKQGKPVVVLEAEEQVGGLAKTVVDPEGYRFDLGGHRFFTKATEVDALWHEIMGDEFLKRPRMSRIYWNGKFLDYPLNGTDVIRKLGPIELMRAGLSYLWAAVTKRNAPEENLEQWVSKRFGWRLYSLFFKSYNEKVWGVPTTEIRAEWAAQRVRERAGGRPRPALSRLPHRRARARRRGPLPRQLDLHPRAGGPGRPHPELPLMEPVDGPRPVDGVRGAGVLLLQGRRAVD